MKEQDNRLFSPNSPICRTWYFINLFLLGILASATHIGVNEYVIPNVKEHYVTPVTYLSYFIYFILLITFFMLVDRRIHDIGESRDSSIYKILSKTMVVTVSVLTITGIIGFHNDKIINSLYPVFVIFACFFVLYLFILGLIPGKLTSRKKE